MEYEHPDDAIRRVRRLASELLSDAFRHYVDLTWRNHNRRAVAHTLPGSLTISLTSYPLRYPTLVSTLRSLFAQRMRPDCITLWIAHADLAALPLSVFQLREYGLDIKPCEDLRSYNKIFHALTLQVPNFIVTADDDQYYHRDWLANLVNAYEPGRKEIVCARAHRIRLDDRAVPLPYFEWDLNVPASSDDSLLFPTGVGGVLYEPGVFHEDVIRKDLFLEICPTADDVWLFWMAALNGATVRKVGPRWREVTWRKSQNVALYRTVNRRANDHQIAQMISHYGFPCVNALNGTQADTRRGFLSRADSA